MTRLQYAEARKKIGTQETVAKLLGVHKITVSKRECGMQAISHEAELALLSLQVKAS